MWFTIEKYRGKAHGHYTKAPLDIVFVPDIIWVGG